MVTTEKFALIETAKLIPYVNNARTHTKEQIKQLQASLREFGFVNPILVDGNFNVIAGHGRLLAAQAEGVEKIPAVFVEHLTEAQKKAYILADNRLAELAGWDEELLKIELDALKELNFDVTLTGFAEFDFKAPIEENELDIVTTVEKPSKAKLGDIWRLGRHKIICGNTIKLETYEKLLGKEKVQLIVSDPPYFVDVENGSGKILNDDLNEDDGLNFLDAAFANFSQIMKSDSSIYIFYASTKAKIFHVAFEKYFKLMAGLVWKKDSAVLSRGDFNFIHEPIMYGKLLNGTHKWYGDGSQSTVLEFPRIKNSETEGFGHPSSKPLALISYLIGLSSKRGDKIFDGFLGSATTLIAAEKLGRICYGIELEPKYIDVAVERFKKTSDDKITVERDGKIFSYEEIINGQEI